jgi:hypothetical protein
LPPEKIVDLRLKHLEFIQAVVSRMSTMSGQIKKLCITVAVALIGASVTLQQVSITFICVSVILIFWALDAQYLRIERKYCLLYEEVRKEDWDQVPSFLMKPDHKISFFSVFKSWSAFGFYGPLLLVLFGISFLIGGFKCLVAFMHVVSALVPAF